MDVLINVTEVCMYARTSFVLGRLQFLISLVFCHRLSLSLSPLIRRHSILAPVVGSRHFAVGHLTAVRMGSC